MTDDFNLAATILGLEMIIKKLEERIINLECSLINARIELPKYDAADDAYYWEHG